MAQAAVTFSTYDAVGLREDLSDLISNISPTDTPFTSNSSVEDCDGTFFEWQTQALAAVDTTNQQIEGDDIGTYAAVTPTVRLGNYTTISRATFMISGTEQVVEKAGRSNERAYQAVLKARELKRDIEAMALANQIAVAGDDSNARKSAGLAAWVKTNVDKGTNGTNPVYTSAATDARSDGVQRPFTETILQSVVKQCWDSGGEPSMVMVGSFCKQALSAFSGIAAQRYMAPDGPTQIVGAADLYISDFGTLSIVPNRFQRARDGWVLDPDLTRIRQLRPYQAQEMARTGDAIKMLFLREWGVQVDNEAGLGLAADLDTS